MSTADVVVVEFLLTFGGSTKLPRGKGSLMKTVYLISRATGLVMAVAASWGFW